MTRISPTGSPAESGSSRLDFSNVLGWREALQVATERLTDVADVMLVESPPLRGDLEGLVEFRRRSTLPVSEHVHGQRHAWQLLHLGAVDILNLSPYVARRHPPDDPGRGHGGSRRSERPARARRRSSGWARPRSPTSARCCRRFRSRPTTSGRVSTPRDVATPPVEFVDGHLVVPTGPGLGPTVDPSLLESLRSNGDWSFGLDLAGAVDRTLPS